MLRDPQHPYTRALLAASKTPPQAVAARSPQVCACFDISEARIAAAEEGFRIAENKRDAGQLSQIEFLDAERTRLQTERQANQVTAQRFIATVRLVKAKMAE